MGSSSVFTQFADWPHTFCFAFLKTTAENLPFLSWILTPIIQWLCAQLEKGSEHWLQYWSVKVAHVLHIEWDLPGWFPPHISLQLKFVCLLQGYTVRFVGHCITVCKPSPLEWWGTGRERVWCDPTALWELVGSQLSPHQVLWPLVCPLCKKHQLLRMLLASFTGKEVCWEVWTSAFCFK